MRIGHKKYVESIRNNDYTILHPDNAVIVAVRTSRTAVEEEDEETEENAEGTEAAAQTNAEEGNAEA
jgi:large subunit ribosomal protein L25